jgi:hypothetical protein
MRLNEEMLGGWLLGDSSTWVLETVLEHVRHLQIARAYKNIIFCGSSLGGFCAIQAASLSKLHEVELGVGGVYAENPQINLLTYKHREAIDLLAKVGFGVPDRESIPSKYLARLNVVSTLKQYSSDFKGLIAIKESDVHHYTDQVPQLKSFLDSTPSCRLRIETIPREKDDTGHTPLSFEEMTIRIAALLQSDS